MGTKHAEVEELKKDENVRRALEQTAEPNKKILTPKVKSGEKVRLGVYFLVLIAVGIVYYLIRLKFLGVPERFNSLLERMTLGAVAVVLAITIGAVVRTVFVERVEQSAARYNLNRVVNLLVGLSIVLIAISMLFADWYTALVSFGVVSLVLGLALQMPITSFLGWIYILIKVPFRVGDRIKIGEEKGDVIDVGYLDTTLWEFGGDHLSTDHPSGRIIKFPNSRVLNTAVYNYSWTLFPYIWNDIKFEIAYQSDLDFVAKIMREAAEEEVGEAMMDHIRTYRELLQQTPVDELEVNEHPVVVFRVGNNTWIEAIVRYLVEPRSAGRVKTRLIKTMLDRLNAEPEKVLFPNGNER